MPTRSKAKLVPVLVPAWGLEVTRCQGICALSSSCSLYLHVTTRACTDRVTPKMLRCFEMFAIAQGRTGRAIFTSRHACNVSL